MGLFSGGYTEEQMLELKAQIKALRDSVTLWVQSYYKKVEYGRM